MKPIRHLILPAALALGISSTLSARPPEGGGGPGGPPPPPPDPIARALDANGDHVIDAGEIADAAAALLTLDANGDGKLTADEFRPPHPPKRGQAGDDNAPPPIDSGDGHRPPPRDKAGHRPPPPPLLKALDLDGDKEISAEEIDAAPESLVSLDRNKDGKLDERELRPGKRPHSGRK